MSIILPFYIHRAGYYLMRDATTEINLVPRTFRTREAAAQYAERYALNQNGYMIVAGTYVRSKQQSAKLKFITPKE